MSVDEYNRKINELIKIVNYCEFWISKYTEERNAICTHERSTYNKEHHFEGSYYDRSYSIYETLCSDCDAVLDSKTVTGGYG